MIVVTTPTGAIGHRVLERLLSSPEKVRVIVRDPSRLPSQVRGRVDVVQGSHGDERVVNQAFAGADSVFWLVPPDPQATSVDAAYVDFTRPACAAIKKQGVFSLPISGDLKQPSACTRDIAATAATLLLDHSWTGVASAPVLGPEDLSYNDMATIMSEVLRKPVRFQQVAGDALKGRLMQRGMSEAMAQANED